MYHTDKRIKDAALRGERWATDAANVRRIRAERAIAHALLRRILKAGYSVRVHDGEKAHPLTSSFEAAWDAMGETDEDTLLIFDEDGTQIGGIMLVWGNDEDLVSDYFWTKGFPDREEIISRLAYVSGEA